MRLVFALFFLLLPAAAFADDPRTVDMTQVIVDDEGTPIKDFGKHSPADWVTVTNGPTAGERIDTDPMCDHCPPLTLGVAIYRVMAFVDDRRDPGVPPEDKEAWHDLGKRLLHDKAAVLTTDEISVIKSRLDKSSYSGMVLGEIKRAIDPTYKTPPLKPTK